MNSLPIDEQLPQIARSLGHNPWLVLEAPPGAGKTTRVPALLLDQNWCDGLVLVSEPRRIAARLSAHRVAEEKGGTLGHEVGYQVRFEDKTSSATRLIYMTEGLLLRRILNEPELPGVSAVVLDEVHERSADLDTLLALLKRLTKLRPDLRIVAMSATLEAQEFSEYFSGSSHHRSEGKCFDVDVHYLSRQDERPLAIQVRSSIRAALAFKGDILVFLPGAREIRNCEAALAQVSNIDVVTLHGDLPVDQQARAISKSSPLRRVVLSTNVAESSLTIPNVTTVIDTGLARTAIFDPWSGVHRLETVTISQARCVQRAGRAGRVAPGRAYRLFTKGQFAARVAQDIPEILRTDLSDLLLRLLESKFGADHTLSDIDWLSPPDESKWHQARQLLLSLGALTPTGLTETGRVMAKLPLPPRLARVVVESRFLDVEHAGCMSAALLSERDIVRPQPPSGQDVVASDSDLEDRIELLEQVREARFDKRLASDLHLDLRTTRQVSRIATSIERMITMFINSKPSRVNAGGSESERLSLALLSGFPDRVASRRGTTRELILSGGLQATLAQQSAVVTAPLLLALAADAPQGRARRPLVRIACRVEADWLMDVRGEEIEAIDEFVWNPEKERVDAVSRLTFGKVTLDESRSEASACSGASETLARAAIQKGPAVYDPDGHLETLLTRLTLLLEHVPEVATALDADSRARVTSWLSSPEKFADHAIRGAAQGCTNLADLRRTHLGDTFVATLPAPLQAALRSDTPLEVQLAGGRRLNVHYERGRDAWIESRLQDFFSMNETPLLCRGRVPLQLHLLAPNKRALQVTTDLSGFWDRHYPDLRKQLMRRYPKHLWPDDGRTASPPRPGRIR